MVRARVQGIRYQAPEFSAGSQGRLGRTMPLQWHVKGLSSTEWLTASHAEAYRMRLGTWYYVMFADSGVKYYHLFAQL